MTEAIIYRNEEVNAVGLDFFFQDPVIESITKENMFDAYLEQKVFFDLIKDGALGKSEDLNNEDVLALLKQDRLFFPKTEKGLELLTLMITDYYGVEEGELIIQALNNKVERA